MTPRRAQAVEAAVVPSPMKPSKDVRMATSVSAAAMLANNGPAATDMPAMTAVSL